MEESDSPDTDRIRIKSTDPAKWFELSDAEPKGLAGPVDSYVFTIRLGELRASTHRLDAHTDSLKDGQTLVRVFADMAAHWRGWSGEKSWESGDREVIMSFTHDGRAAVRVKLRVRNSMVSTWEVRGELELELGSLDTTVRDLAAYLRVEA